MIVLDVEEKRKAQVLLLNFSAACLKISIIYEISFYNTQASTFMAFMLNKKLFAL